MGFIRARSQLNACETGMWYKETRQLTSEASIPTILGEIKDQTHILILDGFADGSEAEKTLADCWRWKDLAQRQTRKLIIVSPMRGISKVQD